MGKAIGVSFALFVVGILVGAGLMWFLDPITAVRPRIVEGQTTAVSENGEAVGLAIEGKEETKGFVIAGALWREHGLPWLDTAPTCVESDRTGQRLRLGVVDAAATDNAPGRTLVVWLECLE